MILTDALWDKGLVKFTRRFSGELNNWAPRPHIPGAMKLYTQLHGDDAAIRAALDAGGQDGDHDDRYTAVNLTNDSTVEFRIFKGTLKRERLIASMQLVDTLIHYAMKHSVEDCCEVEWADVMSYDDHGSSYKELVKYNASLGL